LADVRLGLEQTGGCGVESSSAVQDLTDWLVSSREYHPVVLTYREFSSNLRYLSGGVIAPVDYPWGQDSRGPENPETLADLVRHQPDALYLLSYCHEPCVYADWPKPAIRAGFDHFVRDGGGALRLVKRFDSRDGQAVFEAYRVVGR
jgi:hypothetical protein